MNITSRILQFIPRDLMLELNHIALDVLIPDNNTKIDKMFEAFNRYDVDYQEIASGTNRVAVLIDGFVFKIAMDKAGIRDNWAELSLTQELQPFVIKVYECNGLINVSEYVTVISKSEFNESKEEMQSILSQLAQGYLLGDVGTIPKNFMNWGYRQDGQLVILDFAYIYRVVGDEMMCTGLNNDDTTCTEFLEYDENFNNLICPKCHKKYTFHDIRRRIDRDFEQKELDMIKQTSIKVTRPNTEIDIKQCQPVNNETIQQNNTNKGEIVIMGKHNKNTVSVDIDPTEIYNNAVAFASTMYDSNQYNCNADELLPDKAEDEELSTNNDYAYEENGLVGTIHNSSIDSEPEDCFINEVLCPSTKKDTNNINEDDNVPEPYYYDEESDDETCDNDEETEDETCDNDEESDEESEDETCDNDEESDEESEDETCDNENDMNEPEVEVCDIDDVTPIEDPTLISDNVEVSDYDPEPVHISEDVPGVDNEEVENTDLLETDSTFDVEDDDCDTNPYEVKVPEGFKVFDAGEEMPDEDSCGTTQSYNPGEVIVLSNSKDVESLRSELMADMEDDNDECDDEYEDLYDQNINENQSIRNNKRQKRFN